MTIINIKPNINVAAIIPPTSLTINACVVQYPIPGKLKTASIITAPPKRFATVYPKEVATGKSAFLLACKFITTFPVFLLI